jgi:hypothetical protein
VKHAKGKSAILDASHKVYAWSLMIYPSDLRGDFGSEMMEVFDEQLAEAYFRSGYAGLLGVWFGATREFITVALPARLVGRAAPLAAVTVILAFMVWFAGYVGYVMEKACQSCGR